MSADARLIVLRDGFTARLSAYLIVQKLEADGLRLSVDDDDSIRVKGLLLPEDRAELYRLRADVVNLLRYMPSDARPACVADDAPAYEHKAQRGAA